LFDGQSEISLSKLNFTRNGFFGSSPSSDTECQLICFVG
jgi:hypothetical protein